MVQHEKQERYLPVTASILKNSLPHQSLPDHGCKPSSNLIWFLICLLVVSRAILLYWSTHTCMHKTKYKTKAAIQCTATIYATNKTHWPVGCSVPFGMFPLCLVLSILLSSVILPMQWNHIKVLFLNTITVEVYTAGYLQFHDRLTNTPLLTIYSLENVYHYKGSFFT